ncbi:hypothetical protein GWK36_03065 [Caldichromatium japonicum]|uniref:Uncharacterized protein n=1 Tax=Caldichromatium japonicum TaxID=2699430 RepID=A0A6G7VB56_9GAMM|nr:hypothetical protein GWK36_03065 [Caldichromatium japonicum]
MVERLVSVFTEQTGEPVRLAGGGSGAGIKNALSRSSQIGMVSMRWPSSSTVTIRSSGSPSPSSSNSIAGGSTTGVRSAARIYS